MLKIFPGLCLEVLGTRETSQRRIQLLELVQSLLRIGSTIVDTVNVNTVGQSWRGDQDGD